MNHELRIGQVADVDGSRAEGTRLRVAGLSNALHNGGYDVKLMIARNSSSIKGDFKKCDSPFLRRLTYFEKQIVLMGHPGRATKTFLSPLARICFSDLSDCRILHCHVHWVAAVAERAGKRRNQKLLFDMHGLLVPLDVNGEVIGDLNQRHVDYIGSWQHKIFERADGISVVSEILKSRVCKSFDIDKEKMYVIPDGVDFSFISNGWEPNQVQELKREWGAHNCSVTMYAGRLDNQHGAKYLFEAISELLRDNPIGRGIMIVVIGNGPEEKQFEILERKYRTRMKLISDIPYELLPTYLAAADILLTPHPKTLLMDSVLSIKLLNYLASGKPNVITNLKAASGLLSQGRDALFCKTEDPTSMSDAVKTLLLDPALASTIGLNGKEKVRDYDWSNSAERASEIYHHILSYD